MKLKNVCVAVVALALAVGMTACGGSNMWIGILMVCFVLPAVLSWVFGEILREAAVGNIAQWGKP